MSVWVGGSTINNAAVEEILGASFSAHEREDKIITQVNWFKQVDKQFCDALLNEWSSSTGNQREGLVTYLLTDTEEIRTRGFRIHCHLKYIIRIVSLRNTAYTPLLLGKHLCHSLYYECNFVT